MGGITQDDLNQLPVGPGEDLIFAPQALLGLWLYRTDQAAWFLHRAWIWKNHGVILAEPIWIKRNLS